MELVTTYLCKTSDIGVHSNMFGGNLVALIDQSSAAYASQICDTPRMVTLSISEMFFKKPIKVGNIIKVYANVSAFGNTAEFVGTYVTKGNLIGVQGSLTTRTYEKDGQTHYVVDIRADKVLSYATKSQTIDKPVTGEKETEEDIKALMNKEFAKRSVGLDKEAKENLLKDIRKRYQARLDAASTDLPF